MPDDLQDKFVRTTERTSIMVFVLDNHLPITCIFITGVSTRRQRRITRIEHDADDILWSDEQRPAALQRLIDRHLAVTCHEQDA